MLYPAQEASVREATARLNLWDGSVRSGKTIGSIVRWLRFITVDGPPGNLLMIGKTERTLSRNVLDPIRDLVGSSRCQVKAGSGEVTILGRTVYLAGANDERASDRIRGITLAGAYGDEVSLWPRSFFTMLLSRLSVPGAALFATTNPDGPRHWLKTDYLDRADELDLARFRFRLPDNPGLDPAYVVALQAEYVGLWRARFIDGLWVAAEGAIYDTFDPTPGGPHVQPIPAPTDDQPQDAGWVAIDYGTSNPFVALRLRHHLGRVYVTSEYRWDSRARRRQLTDSDYADALAAWWGTDEPPAIIVDPSAASFIAELRQRGYPVQGANNAVLDGIRLVATELNAGRLIIDPTCTGLIDELAGYSWDPKAQAHGQDAPLKADDHGPDALRYGMRAADHVGPGALLDSEW